MSTHKIITTEAEAIAEMLKREDPGRYEDMVLEVPGFIERHNKRGESISDALRGVAKTLESPDTGTATTAILATMRLDGARPMVKVMGEIIDKNIMADVLQTARTMILSGEAQ